MSFLVKKEFKEIKNSDLKSTIKCLRKNSNNIEYISKEKHDNADEIINLNKRIFKIIKKNVISIISILIIVLIMVNFKYCFVNINVNINNNKIKNMILLYCEKYYYSFGPFKYLNESIENINFALKSDFYEYEWIYLSKNGINLNIDVKNKDELNNIEDNNKVGDLIALKDGIIITSYVTNGIIVKKNNEYVQKDELLISGNLLLNVGKTKYIKAKGIVIANTFEMKTIQVLKKEINYTRSGRVKVIKKNIFSSNKLNCDFDNYETEIVEGKNFLSNTYIYCYEIIEMININELENSKIIAKNNIINEFNNKKIHKDELIEEIILLSYDEDDEYFYFNYLIKANENIAIFKEFIS